MNSIGSNWGACSDLLLASLVLCKTPVATHEPITAVGWQVTLRPSPNLIRPSLDKSLLGLVTILVLFSRARVLFWVVTLKRRYINLRNEWMINLVACLQLTFSLWIWISWFDLRRVLTVLTLVSIISLCLNRYTLPTLKTSSKRTWTSSELPFEQPMHMAYMTQPLHSWKSWCPALVIRVAV